MKAMDQNGWDRALPASDPGLCAVGAGFATATAIGDGTDTEEPPVWPRRGRSPASLEELLLSHPSVVEVAVVGLPDHKYGEVVDTVVRPAAGARIDESELSPSPASGSPNTKRPSTGSPLTRSPSQARARSRSTSSVSGGRTPPSSRPVRPPQESTPTHQAWRGSWGEPPVGVGVFHPASEQRDRGQRC